MSETNFVYLHGLEQYDPNYAISALSDLKRLKKSKSRNSKVIFEDENGREKFLENVINNINSNKEVGKVEFEKNKEKTVKISCKQFYADIETTCENDIPSLTTTIEKLSDNETTEMKIYLKGHCNGTSADHSGILSLGHGDIKHESKMWDSDEFTPIDYTWHLKQRQTTPPIDKLKKLCEITKKMTKLTNLHIVLSGCGTGKDGPINAKNSLSSYVTEVNNSEMTWSINLKKIKISGFLGDSTSSIPRMEKGVGIGRYDSIVKRITIDSERKKIDANLISKIVLECIKDKPKQKLYEFINDPQNLDEDIFKNKLNEYFKKKNINAGDSNIEKLSISCKKVLESMQNELDQKLVKDLTLSYNENSLSKSDFFISLVDAKSENPLYEPIQRRKSRVSVICDKFKKEDN
ncbi:hypothetical protein ACK1CN_00870 [Vibrio coralliilyticus]|uniref:hypothetical protein n=1 Tax=Vibrio coralliilyticus TaxID=190893 RepID=UPI00391729A7